MPVGLRGAMNFGAGRNDKLATVINVFSNQADDGRLDRSGVHRDDRLARDQSAEGRVNAADFLRLGNIRRAVGKQTDGRFRRARRNGGRRRGNRGIRDNRRRRARRLRFGRGRTKDFHFPLHGLDHLGRVGAIGRGFGDHAGVVAPLFAESTHRSPHGLEVPN